MTQQKDTVYLPLTHCDECPHLDRSRYYTADAFEDIDAWNCKHTKFKRIKNGKTDQEEWKSPPGIARVDWHDDRPPIPAWCPLRKRNRKKERRK